MISHRLARLLQGLVAAGALLVAGQLLASAAAHESKRQQQVTGWATLNPPEEVSALALQDDTLWAGGSEGIFRVDLNAQQVLEQTPEEAALKYTRALFVDAANRLWVGHDQGLSCLDGQRWSHYTTAHGLPDNRVNALALDLDGFLWVGTWGGAVKLDIQTPQPTPAIVETLRKSNGLLDDMVNVILCDRQDGLWFGAYNSRTGGVSYRSGSGAWHYWTIDQGLPHNYVTAIVEDQAGDIWVGTGLLELGGLSRFTRDGPHWQLKQTLLKSQGLAGEKVRSIFQDARGVLWIGSEYDGVALQKKDGWLILNQTAGLSDNEVKVMLQDRPDRIWLGTRAGISYTTSGLP